jgi:RNA polymerase sigma-32 factor
MAVIPFASPHFPHLNDDTGLMLYFEKIRRFPMLTQAQELEFARRWRGNEDRAAAQALITSHLRLVAKVAQGYRRYGLPMSDLIAEGNLGMMKAVKKFDPEKGFRLATYAVWWIKASIQEYILHSWSLVKIGTTAAQKKLFFNLRRLKNKMHRYDNNIALTPSQLQGIASELAVSVEEVAEMSGRLASGDYSLNASLDRDGESLEWQDVLEDNRDTPEAALLANDEYTKRLRELSAALHLLNEREYAIFTARRLQDPPVTLEELATRHAISRERVRQIEQRAFEKIQTTVNPNRP